MRVYQLPVSLYSFKLRLAIRLKGLDVALVEPPGGTYRSPEYRAIVPAGSIPALVDGDLVLPESEAIIEYLEDRGEGVPLFPADIKARARCRMLSRWHDLRLEPAVHALFAQVAPAGRDAAVVAEAGTRIGAALTLIEANLDPTGPFALGTAPTSADCALAASLTWLEVFEPVFGLAPPAAPRAARGLSALAAHPACAAEFAEYRVLARRWTEARL